LHHWYYIQNLAISFSLLSYTHYLQMPRAPPPPNPKVAQLLRLIMEDREASRAERQANLATLQQLTQMAMNHNNGHGEGENNGNGDHRSKLRSFQNTNPPMFTKSEEPLDADDWLRTMENNLEVARVGEHEKVLYTTHYLAGAARAWWDSTRAMQA
jgi:hypothetical protein